MEEALDTSAERRARTVDRFITFSDGVVAVAITLLALPLVSTLPAEGQSALELAASNLGPIAVFLFTFAVVAIMWSAHNRVVNGLRTYDGVIFWLNTAWLALIVLLPWVSDLYGDSELLGTDPGDGSAAILYWGVLALISAVGWLMAWHLGRHPDMQADPGESQRTRRGLVFAVAFVVFAASWLIVPAIAAWLPLALIPLSIWLRPVYGTRSDRSAVEVPR